MNYLVVSKAYAHLPCVLNNAQSCHWTPLFSHVRSAYCAQAKGWSVVCNDLHAEDTEGNNNKFIRKLGVGKDDSRQWTG